MMSVEKLFPLFLLVLLSACHGDATSRPRDASAGSNETSFSGLEELRWRHRILLVDAVALPRVEARLETLRADLEERDLVVFMRQGTGDWIGSDGDPVVSSLAKSCDEELGNDKASRVVLIGKDGGVKARHSELDPEEIFALIDAMPMRRDEIRRRR